MSELCLPAHRSGFPSCRPHFPFFKDSIPPRPLPTPAPPPPRFQPTVLEPPTGRSSSTLPPSPIPFLKDSLPSSSTPLNPNSRNFTEFLIANLILLDRKHLRCSHCQLGAVRRGMEIDSPKRPSHKQPIRYEIPPHHNPSTKPAERRSRPVIPGNSVPDFVQSHPQLHHSYWTPSL